MKRILAITSILALVLVISACGSKEAEVGLNELSLKELEEKLDNNESFLLITFAIDEEGLEQTKALEAFDSTLSRSGMVGFYTNLIDETDETIEELGENYKHAKSNSWDPAEDGLRLVENGGIIDDHGEVLFQGWIDSMVEDNDVFADDEFDRGLRGILEYVDVYNVELTN